MEGCETLKSEFLLLLQDKTSPITVTQKNDYSYVYTLNNQTHTFGSLLQSHISRRCITKDGMILSCGYKQPHPLEDSLKLFISLNPSHKLSKDTELHKLQNVTTFLMEQLATLKDLFKDIRDVSDRTL